MTIYTIIYNGYGVFLEEWVKHVKKTKPKEIIVVLGKNHGVKTRPTGVTYVNCNSDIMGTLRNAAVKEITTEWMLYFSVDDELYANVLEQIDYAKDACVLKFIDTPTDVTRGCETLNTTNILNWRTTTVPGYIALKRVFKGSVMYYDDIEIPNYPYLFKMVYMGYKITNTKDVCAKYIRREGSHGDISNHTGRMIEFAKHIDTQAKHYYDLIKGSIVTIDFNDKELGRMLHQGDMLETEYDGKLTQERKNFLKSLGFIKIKE